MAKLSKSEAQRLVHEIIKGKEDFVYLPPDAQCVYFYEGAPSCLVGHVMAKRGIKPEEVTEHETPDAMSELFTKGAAEYLTAIQAHQDLQIPWGEAVAVAEREQDD